MVEEGVPGPSGAGSAEEVFPRESRSPRERPPDLGLWAKPPLQGPGSIRTLARCWGFGLLGGTESNCGPGTDSAPGAGDAKCVPVATPATSRGCFSLGALCVTPLDGSRHVASNPTCRSGLDPTFGSGSGSYGSAAFLCSGTPATGSGPRSTVEGVDGLNSDPSPAPLPLVSLPELALAGSSTWG